MIKKKLNSKVLEDTIKSIISEDDLLLYKDLGNGLYKLPGNIIANQKGYNKCLEKIQTLIKMKNDYFGWVLKDNPNFWEDNGFKKIDSSDYHYYGCASAKLGKYPVYRKTVYINEDSEDISMVEVFPCEIGSIKHNYIVSIHIWNNAGGSRFPLVVARQICNIRSFNQFILDNIGDNLDDGSYLLKYE